MQLDSFASLLFLFRKLKWIFPVIFIHYVVNFYVLMCFSHHSPQPHPSSQLIHFPISKQITAVGYCDKLTSICILLKLSLISVVIWLVLLRIMFILLTKIRLFTFNTNLCQFVQQSHMTCRLLFFCMELHDRGMAREFSHNHGHPRKIQQWL